MIIGTLRPEEAKVFDGSAGDHLRNDGTLVHVFWHEASAYRDENGRVWEPPFKPGWYWSTPGSAELKYNGPFGTSHRALADGVPEDDDEE